MALVWGAPTPTLQGHRAKNWMFVWGGGQRGALAPGGGVGSAPPPVMNALPRNSSPFSQHSFPVPTAHRTQGAPTELPGHGSDLTERFLTLSEMQKLLPLPLPAHPRNAEGAGTKAGRSSWSSANPQVFPRRGVQEGVGVQGWCSPPPGAGLDRTRAPFLLTQPHLSPAVF